MGITPVHVKIEELKRTARTAFMDKRNLPFFKDVLSRAMPNASAIDMIVWTNDDVSFAPGIDDWVLNHAYPNGAASMRRNESGHIGRELFAFTKEWLSRHWDSIPDFVQGAPCFDLVMAALIRKHHGIWSDLDNLKLDIWPSETPHRLALHEPHQSSWAGNGENVHPANLWNKRLAREWCGKNMPQLKL